MKLLKKLITWLNNPLQRWIKATAFIVSACLSLLYFIFPNGVCGEPFLVTSIVIFCIAMLLYIINNQDKETEITKLLCSFPLSTFVLFSVLLCFEFSKANHNVIPGIKAIEIVTFIIGAFGIGMFIDTIQKLIHKYKKNSRDCRSNIKFPYATIVSILISTFGLVTAILNSVTSFMKVHS